MSEADQDKDKSMDKKEIAEEEREKMLNAENTKHTGAAPAPDLESEEQKPRKKIPIGGIKMPGFCRTKSKEPCKVCWRYTISIILCILLSAKISIRTKQYQYSYKILNCIYLFCAHFYVLLKIRTSRLYFLLNATDVERSVHRSIIQRMYTPFTSASSASNCNCQRISNP